MARNPKNNAVCEYLAAAISEAKKNGKVTISSSGVLIKAYNALVMEPPPCQDDCLWAKMERPQKCNCCARNRRLNDLYERG